MPIETNSGFARPTMQELIDRITGDLNSRIAGVEGGLARRALSALRLFTPILAAVMAGVAYLIYQYLDSAIDQFFVQTATGDNLDRWGELWDTPRKAATRARRVVRVRGEAGTEAPTGRLLTRSDGFQYEVSATGAPWIVADHDGDAYVDVTVEAKTPGADGNVAADDVLTFASPVAGLESEAPVLEGGSDGADAESDGDLRERILFHIAYPPSGGAPIDYIRWATEVTSVRDAWCLRAWPQPGYVAVLYANRESFGDPENSFSPIPPGGGAYTLPVAEAGADDDGPYAKIPKAALAAALGRDPEEGWFANGSMIHDIDNPLGFATTKVDAVGLRAIEGDLINWKVVFDSAPSPALNTEQAIHLLCAYTDAVYASIHHRDETHGVEDRKPSEATCHVILPLAKTVDITLSVPNDNPNLRADITAELAAMIADERGPQKTITAWQFREAISQAPGHIAHRVIDINGGGPETDVTTALNEIHVLGTVTFVAWS